MQSGLSLILCVGFNGGMGFARERALSAAGFRVAAISEPLRAITSASHSGPQAIVIDDQYIHDWRELADCLAIASPMAKVVVMVGVPDIRPASVTALLSKPITPEGLVQAIQSILNGQPNTPNSAMTHA